ncbi:MAG: Fic family protein [Bdellovibrionales bacterium]|nr:Fic family protein [Bdellovibrionales bacterium]
MLDVQMRPSLRLVQQVGRIERFAGAWDRLSRSSALASEERSRKTLHEGACAALALDHSTSAVLSVALKQRKRGGSAEAPLLIEREVFHENGTLQRPPVAPLLHPELEAYLLGFSRPAPLTCSELEETYRLVIGALPTDECAYRRSSTQFLTPEDQVVFPAVSSFLVASRLEELMEWIERELDSGDFHPLTVIGTFHLLFLHIHPYPRANHRLALLLTWQLLVDHGFSFVAHRHFAPLFAESNDQYFGALRQAEKSVYQNWSTLNIWLEYFLETLAEASHHLMDESERNVASARLSRVQQQIMTVVRQQGAVSRERIVSATGINLSTVKYNLSVLAQRGHLKRHGGGRTTSYSLV